MSIMDEDLCTIERDVYLKVNQLHLVGFQVLAASIRA